jgi:hypothetical protein
MFRISARLLSPTVLAVVISFSTVGLATAAAANSLSLKKVTPASGPEYSSFPVTIRGSGFSTTPGATTVLFGSTPATEVSCKSVYVCKAITPELAEGLSEVSVEVAGAKSTSLPFSFGSYSPPKVEIEEYYAVSLFNPRKITDRYPGIFTPGNVYLQITNKTYKDQTFTGPTGTVTLESGQTEGYNFPIDEATPYVFELAGTTPSKGTLTVKTRTPR